MAQANYHQISKQELSEIKRMSTRTKLAKRIVGYILEQKLPTEEDKPYFEAVNTIFTLQQKKLSDVDIRQDFFDKDFSSKKVNYFFALAGEVYFLNVGMSPGLMLSVLYRTYGELAEKYKESGELDKVAFITDKQFSATLAMKDLYEKYYAENDESVNMPKIEILPLPAKN